RHLLQFADDGSFARERYWSPRKVDIAHLDVGETYEDEVIIDGWKDARGRRVEMAPLPLDSRALVSTIPFEQWQPTSEDYEGYTGNAGNTLDRWYHKSAVVLWSSRDHFDVLVKMGMRPAIEAWLQMRDELPKLSDDKAKQAETDCASLARAIVRAWPDRLYRHASLEKEDSPWLADFAAELPALKDSALAGDFLQTVARRDWRLSLDKLVMDGCRHLGADAMSRLLTDYLSTTPEPNRYGRTPAHGLPVRDAEWLCKLAAGRKQGGMTPQQLAMLCRSATDRLREYLDEQTARYYHHQREYDEVLARLLKAALAAGDDGSFAALLQLKRARPDLFDVRKFDVPTCSKLVKWADKRFEERPVELARWLAEIRQFLKSATSQPPQPPSDFARPGRPSCICPYCRQLGEFLADPKSESGAIKARKDDLLHVQDQIRRHQLDAKSRVDRTTRPFALVLTKTTDSHTRAVKQYYAGQKLLANLR
ncbi:MAG: hypothetical protein KY475_25345, partial [Planctomycetes bacterium]|nr:hypothetical protein [Planctomycetota bacterium]